MTRDRNGARWTVYGLPGGYLMAARADVGTEGRTAAVPLITIRADAGTLAGTPSLATMARIRTAYGWVLATHDVR